MHAAYPKLLTNPITSTATRTLILHLILAAPVMAAQDSGNLWKSCPVATLSDKALQPLPHFPAESQDEIRISAEEVSKTGADETRFSGAVLLEREGLRLTTEELLYNQPEQRIQLDTELQLHTQELALDALHGWYKLDTKTGQFFQTRYLLPQQHFRGGADIIDIPDEQHAALSRVSITSCPDQSHAWELETDLLNLDYQTQTGTAKDAVLWFQGVPIFYFPWVQFPLGEQRRSGFLMPSFGNSNSRGFELHVPWYWNIAPNQDAIITPGNLGRRGFMLTGQYRYLTHSSNGQLEFDYLPDDQVTNQERHLGKFINHSNLGSGTSMDILAQRVSDDAYLRDLGSDISVTNTTHLESRLNLNHSASLW